MKETTTIMVYRDDKKKMVDIKFKVRAKSLAETLHYVIKHLKEPIENIKTVNGAERIPYDM